MTKEQAIALLSKDMSVYEIHRLRDKGLSHTEVTDTIQEAMDMGIEAIENDKKIYNKAINDFAEKISKYGTYDNYGNVIDILEIAEEIKGQVE